MAGIIITAMICATFIWFAHTYIQPYVPVPKEEIQEVDEKTENEVINMDSVIAEIYERLDDEH